MQISEILTNPSSALGQRVTLEGWISSDFWDHNLVHLDSLDPFETTWYRPDGWLEFEPDLLQLARQMRCGCGGRRDHAQIEAVITAARLYSGHPRSFILTLRDVTRMKFSVWRFGCEAYFNRAGVSFEVAHVGAPVISVAQLLKEKRRFFTDEDVCLEGFLLARDGIYCLIGEARQGGYLASILNGMVGYIQQQVLGRQQDISHRAVLMNCQRGIGDLLKTSGQPDEGSALLRVQVVGRLFRSPQGQFPVEMDAQTLILRITENCIKVYDLTVSFPGLEDCG